MITAGGALFAFFSPTMFMPALFSGFTWLCFNANGVDYAVGRF